MTPSAALLNVPDRGGEMGTKHPQAGFDTGSRLALLWCLGGLCRVGLARPVHWSRLASGQPLALHRLLQTSQDSTS